MVMHSWSLYTITIEFLQDLKILIRLHKRLRNLMEWKAPADPKINGDFWVSQLTKTHMRTITEWRAICLFTHAQRS